MRVEPSGSVYVATGLTTQGQGHQTTFAQIAADALGCDPADVTVVTGDTSRFNWGAGTFASRALVTAGNAVATAAGKVRDKALRLAAELLEVAPTTSSWSTARSASRASPGGAHARRPRDGREPDPLRLRQGGRRGGAAAGQAAPGGRASRGRGARPRSPRLLRAAAGDLRERLPRRHRRGRRRDRRRALPRVRRSARLRPIVNPTIVEGQIHGGVAQGIGGALYEKLATTSPASRSPAASWSSTSRRRWRCPPSRSCISRPRRPLNPLGVKGVGEAGAIPVPALVAEAIEDALAPFGVRVREMPLSPERIRELIERGQALTSKRFSGAGRDSVELLRSRESDPAPRAPDEPVCPRTAPCAGGGPWCSGFSVAPATSPSTAGRS